MKGYKMYGICETTPYFLSGQRYKMGRENLKKLWHFVVYFSDLSAGRMKLS